MSVSCPHEMDPESMTLAARHYKNRWIATKQCYTCHKDYGFNGEIKAKMDGFRHLVKYTLKMYEEPIRFRCHGFPHPTPLDRTPGTARYEELHRPMVSGEAK